MTLLPIQGSFRIKDENGVQGLSSVVISLHLAFILYGLTISLTEILINIIGARELSAAENLAFYLVVYKYFHPVISLLSLVVMMVTSIVQAIINFHICLEQLCILIDELSHRSMTKNVDKANKAHHSFSQ